MHPSIGLRPLTKLSGRLQLIMLFIYGIIRRVFNLECPQPKFWLESRLTVECYAALMFGAVLSVSSNQDYKMVTNYPSGNHDLIVVSFWVRLTRTLVTLALFVIFALAM